MRAARVDLDMARDLIAQKVSFSLETTLSGKTHLGLIAGAKASGMAVKLLYFYLSTPQECLRRGRGASQKGGMTSLKRISAAATPAQSPISAPMPACAISGGSMMPTNFHL